MSIAKRIIEKQITDQIGNVVVLDVEFDEFGVCVELQGDITPQQLKELESSEGFHDDGFFFGNRNLVRNFTHVE